MQLLSKTLNQLRETLIETRETVNCNATYKNTKIKITKRLYKDRGRYSYIIIQNITCRITIQS